MTDLLERDQDDTPQAGPDTRLRTILLVVLAVAALVIAAGGGWLLRGDGADASAAGSPSAVDIGFAQDMTTHHIQAVTMAGIERDNTTNSQLKILAFDIETGQEFQVGEMSGWLETWNKPTDNPDQMAWMGHDHMTMAADGLMPGMATQAQMSRLGTLRGKAQDILFLQLMIHHHQGGVPMAQYAAEHGSSAQVRNLASKIAAAQGTEIIDMEQLLRQLGGRPIAPPT